MALIPCVIHSFGIGEAAPNGDDSTAWGAPPVSSPQLPVLPQCEEAECLLPVVARLFLYMIVEGVGVVYHLHCFWPQQKFIYGLSWTKQEPHTQNEGMLPAVGATGRLQMRSATVSGHSTFSFTNASRRASTVIVYIFSWNSYDLPVMKPLYIILCIYVEQPIN